MSSLRHFEPALNSQQLVADTLMTPLQVPVTGPGRALAALFRNGGASVELVDDFLTAQWRKLCMNAVAGLMAVIGRTAEIYRSERFGELAHRLASECIRVGRAERAKLDDHFADELVAEFRGRPTGSGTSILADRLAGRPLEWEARNGVIQRVGIRHGIPTPVTDVLIPLLAVVSDG